MPQGSSAEAKQIEQEGRKEKRGITKSAGISVPSYFLIASILHKCSAVIIQSQRPHNPETKL